MASQPGTLRVLLAAVLMTATPIAMAAGAATAPALEGVGAAARPGQRVVLVTGSTNGLGREVARALAARGDHVILHGRSAERGAELLAEIEALGKGSARFYQADFASLRQVRALADAVLRDYTRLDALVNNAGIALIREPGRQLTADGHEAHFQVNHLSGYLLTRLLLPRLRESAPSRIVNVSSLSEATPDFDNLMLEADYSPWRAYGQSKLAQVMFTFELAETLERTGVTVNALHPSTFMNTQMVIGNEIEPRTSVETGRDAVLRLLDDPQAGNGRFFNVFEPARAADAAYDVAMRRRLMEVSDTLVGWR
jgi:NAD(P)-dependent dehydrogenase (short-subunit alcohol dehydrogenase family)